MYHVLLLLAVGFGFPLTIARVSADHDLAMEETAPHMQVYSLEDKRGGHDGHHKQIQTNKQIPHNIHKNRGNSNIDRIVSELNNPDMESIMLPDYKYLKTGRDYTRGHGDQFLKEKKESENYDVMLEYLLQKQLAELQAHHQKILEMGHGAYNNHIRMTGDQRLGHYQAQHHHQRNGQHYDQTYGQHYDQTYGQHYDQTYGQNHGQHHFHSHSQHHEPRYDQHQYERAGGIYHGYKRFAET